MTNPMAVNQTMLETAVNAATGGHDLTGFEPAGRGGWPGLPDAVQKVPGDGLGR